MSCILALEAVSRGNFGVGALLVHAGRIVAEGQNSNFSPRFRSDLDAEMVALNRFERSTSNRVDAGRMTLYSTVECCPMCTARIITAGIGTVRFVIRDNEWGQASRLANLPPGWRGLVDSRGPAFSRMVCAPLLEQAASDIYDIGRLALEERVGKNSR
jgi:cytosine deaminase